MKTFLFFIFMLFSAQALSQNNSCVLLEDTSFAKKTIIIISNAYDHGHLYKIDQSQSRVGFCIETSVGRVESEFKEFVGSVLVKENNKPVVMVIDTDSLTSGNFFITAVMKGEELFATDEYPTMKFEGTDITWVTNTTGYLDGIFTIRGVEKPLRLEVVLKEFSMTHILVSANTVIDRTDFGMDALQGLASTTVELCMEIKAVRITTK